MSLPPQDRNSQPPRIILAGGRLSNVSGLVTAAIMAVSFILSAILIPVAAHLPKWIEFEIVLGTWWATWFVVATGLLFRGVGVDDDAPSPSIPTGLACAVSDGCPASCWMPIGDSCGEAIGWGIVVVLVVFALYLVVELVIPAVAFAIYWMIVRLLGRVVNDRNDCKGSLVRATFWGFAWASLYIFPLVVLVWGFHFLHRHV